MDFVRVPAQTGTNGRPCYFVFLINKERIKSNGFMKMFSVKIKWSKQDTKEQDMSSDFDLGQQTAE